MERFMPRRVFFEPRALDYPLGEAIYERIKQLGVDIQLTPSHNRVTGIPGSHSRQAYQEAKRTLVVGVRKSGAFTTCKPSAHYQLPLATSCPGMCEYCYLATTLGKKPYLRVYVNIEEILQKAQTYIAERRPEITVFEGAATSDPVPVEHLTGLLGRTIAFFGQQELGRFRFVTKHVDIDDLLNIPHNGHTRFRFSLNAQPYIAAYEHHTPSMQARIAAAEKVAKAGYPLGFILAPVFYVPGWQQMYRELFQELERLLPAVRQSELTFEIISHRFTKRAKTNILDLFPATTLPLDETQRKYKFGQFGYGKYVYEQAAMEEMKTFFYQQINRVFPAAQIDYFV